MNKPPSRNHSAVQLLSLLRGRAQAEASITGSEHYPELSGLVRFFQTSGGVLVCAVIGGLPQSSCPCHEQIFGFHIHKGTSCEGSMDEGIRTTPEIFRRSSGTAGLPSPYS